MLEPKIATVNLLHSENACIDAVDMLYIDISMTCAQFRYYLYHISICNNDEHVHVGYSKLNQEYPQHNKKSIFFIPSRAFKMPHLIDVR